MFRSWCLAYETSGNRQRDVTRVYERCWTADYEIVEDVRNLHDGIGNFIAAAVASISVKKGGEGKGQGV